MTDVQGRGLTFRQRREMGLTVINVIRVTRQLASDGTISKDTPQDEVIDAVINQLVFENPKAAADPTIDWEAIAAFLERIMPLILTILSLFGI
jgi:hypothetical protein